MTIQTGKIAIVTGASTGIGATIAERLAKDGYTVVVNYAGNTAAAEDLVQEAVLAIHFKRHTYDPTEPLTPWVHAIARYKLIDFLRRTRRSISDVPIEEADAIMAHDDNVDAESTFDVKRLIERLPKNMRCAIEAVRLDGLSIAEAAQRCGISEPGVKVNIHRGLKALAGLIAREKRT